MKTCSCKISITVVAALFLFSAAGGSAFAWYGRGYGYHHHGYHHGHHHYGDYWGGLALGFGLGVIIPYLFYPPRVYNPPVDYTPAAQPRHRILACEPKHYVEETRWDGRQQRYVVTREYFPEHCWYEYR